MNPSPPDCSFHTGAPEEWIDCTVEDANGVDIAVRVYRASAGSTCAPLVLHFHGGSFVGGTLDTGVAIARRLVAASATVISVDYPLGPAMPFPAAIEAGRAALAWAWLRRSRLAGKKDAQLFVAGEEAGGNLAAALAMVARDRRQPPLAGQILISPMLDARVGTASMRASHAGTAGCRWAKGWCGYLGRGAAADHPYATPARALRLAGLPPALVVTATDDPLRDEALAYAERMREAGTPVSVRVLPAPTGWPCSISKAGAESASWNEPLTRALRDFLGAGARCRNTRT